jgi:hypothetical protein
MRARGRYDGELQMFRDEVREPDPEALVFLRWLAEQGKLEHETFSPPTGEYAHLHELDHSR